MPVPPPAPSRPALPSPARLRSLLAAIGRGLLERESAVRLALLAALAGEHVLLIGPPGTAKSALARRVHLGFTGARYFERLLTRFSTPEELFGPLSLKALEDDRYERLTEGFLPTAGIAFLDEVFKANSAILNALLMLLNERCFDNGTARVRTPLVAVVAASNEVPSDEALHAFYDRFLVRVPVAPVGDASFAALLALADADADDREAAPPAEALQPAEREALAAAAQRVALGADFVAACAALRGWLAARNAPLSDRRWRQIVGLARVAAASEGRRELDRLDLWFAPFVASRTPEDVPTLESWFVDEGLAAPPAASPWLERAVQAFEQQLQIEQQAPAEGGALDDEAGKMAALGRGGVDDAEAAAGRELAGRRIVSARLEARLRRRWSPLHIRARVDQVAEVEAQVAAAGADVARASETLAAALATRLWLPPERAAAIRARFDAARATLDALARRLAAAREGFAALPCDDAAPDIVPPAPIGIDAPGPPGALAPQPA